MKAKVEYVKFIKSCEFLGIMKLSKIGAKILLKRYEELEKSINFPDYFELVKTNHYFEEKRKEQNQYWMLETINEQLKTNFFNHPEIEKLLDENKKAVQNDEISPFAAAQLLLKKYFK